LWNPWVLRQIYTFGFAYCCPICRARIRRFLDYSPNYRHVECPRCALHPRHRLMWLYLTRKNRYLLGPAPLKLLHIAPEKAFSALFESLPNITYVSGDLTSLRAMVRIDLTKLPFPNEAFGAIYCSHVLEHIEDDKTAMRELLRVLEPGGWAILQVPIDVTRDVTLEDPAIRTPEDREKYYWQFDHVRLYGNDYQARLESEGFEVTVDWYAKTFNDAEVRRFGLEGSEGIFFCRKPACT
jgi:SAM-dependent methyltransferase